MDLQERLEALLSKSPVNDTLRAAILPSPLYSFFGVYENAGKLKVGRVMGVSANKDYDEAFSSYLGEIITPSAEGTAAVIIAECRDPLTSTALERVLRSKSEGIRRLFSISTMPRIDGFFLLNEAVKYSRNLEGVYFLDCLTEDKNMFNIQVVRQKVPYMDKDAYVDALTHWTVSFMVGKPTSFPYEITHACWDSSAKKCTVFDQNAGLAILAYKIGLPFYPENIIHQISREDRY